MMKEMNCDICYPKQAQESTSPVRKKDIAKSRIRSATCNFSAQYDAGRDTRRRHRRQYEVKQVTCQKCQLASSSEDINSAKTRFWRRARKPEMEDKGIGYSWSKRSFANMRNFLHRPCKWCKDYKDTSSQCASAKKDDAKFSNKPFPPIQTRTLTVMTDKKITRDKSALMNLPTIKEDCAVQTRSKGITKPIKLKNYPIYDSAVGPSHVGDNIIQKERTKKSFRNRKMPDHAAAVEQANIGDTAVVDLYNKDNQSSDESDDKKKVRKRETKIGNKRCGIWNIQFLTHAKHYPAIRLEISPRQTMNKLGEALPKISRETAKENIISWFDYKTHSKSTLRSKKHAPERRKTTTKFRGMQNYIVNRCTISTTELSDNKTDVNDPRNDASIISEISNSISTITGSSLSAPNECAYDIQTRYFKKDNDKNIYRAGSLQPKVDVYQLFTNIKDSTSTVNRLFDTSSISLINAEEVDLDSKTLYDSLVLRGTDNEDEYASDVLLTKHNKAYIIKDNALSEVTIGTVESNTYIIVSASDSLSSGSVLQSNDLKMAVLDLYSESKLSDNIERLHKRKNLSN